MVLGKSTRFLLAPSGSCERQNLAWKGDWASPGDTRTTPGELVGRSSMGRGAKSKGFVRLGRLAVEVTSESKLLLRQQKICFSQGEPEAARGRCFGSPRSPCEFACVSVSAHLAPAAQ